MKPRIHKSLPEWSGRSRQRRKATSDTPVAQWVRAAIAVAQVTGIGCIAPIGSNEPTLLMRAEFICMAIVALAWGGYPLIARASGIGGPLGALILTLSALVPIFALTIWQGVIARPTSAELTKLVIAGMIMGIGTAAFNFVANSRQLEASISIPIIDTAMLLVSVMAAAVFFAEPMTAKKIVGIGLLIAGILVLKPS